VTGSRRLSLRARMLVMLVGVTTALLIIMGTVSTLLLSHEVAGLIVTSDDLIAQNIADIAPTCVAVGTTCPAQLQADNYAVVKVPLRPVLTAVGLTQGSLTRDLVRAVDQQLAEPGFADVRQLASQGLLTKAGLTMYDAGCPVGAQVTASQAGARFPYLNCRPFNVGQGIRVASRIFRPGTFTASTGVIIFVGERLRGGVSQVRGFIIAELITGAALIGLVAVVGEWLIGQGLEPLYDMAATADEITTLGDLTARMPDADGQTEVGRLGSAINTMLDRIQQAFSMRLHSEQKVREFAADASHELRTPLTTIRGYAELYRQGALGPDQLPNAMRRIEQEAQRMSTLVAELLELARLDRTSSLDLTETDLAAVVRDAVADAVAVQPQRPVRAEAPPRLVAVVDERRVRQVLANLLSNVRAHTPPTTPVAVRLGAISGGVLIEVADGGPGMSAEDAIRAFDRFHRAADRSESGWSGEDDGGQARRDRSGGSGLGLSIVQAIATAHGGQATLESKPGQGTKVRVWLPVRTVPSPALPG
jgi:signal transduction histidine kinase